jgi:mRNA-degrading endonuclease RelE of RelBE toxin-antitoxin system
MKIRETRTFRKQHNVLSKKIKKKFQKQINFLTQDFNYPSLRTKKYKGKKDVWEARIDYHNRFLFTKEDDIITLLAIGPHDEVLKN